MVAPSEYWVSGSTVSIGQRVLHVDRGCPQLKRAEDDRKATETEIEECDVCKVCSGERTRSPPDFSYQRALKEAADNG